MITLALLALALQGAPQTANARTQSDSALDAQTTSVAMQLRCPVCQGESIQESPAELAQQMRALVREQLRDGKSPEEIKAYFASKYGEWILLQPKASGFNMLVYALPIAVVIAGLAVVAMAVKKWTRVPDDAGPTGVT